MSDIETNLQNILTKVYGKDVRQSIHDAIHDCYEDGKAGSTDLVARERISQIISNSNASLSGYAVETKQFGLSDQQTQTQGYSYTGSTSFSEDVTIIDVVAFNSVGQIGIPISYNLSNRVLTATATVSYTVTGGIPVLAVYLVQRPIKINELADIRIGEDGTEYATAGDAVREQISDLKSQIDQIEEEIAGGTGSGLTAQIKQALIGLADAVGYRNSSIGATARQALYDALYAVTAISLNTNSLSFGSLGATQQLTATTTPEGGNVVWTSSDTSIATVDQTGLVTSVAYGNATITATAWNVSATCGVLIAQATVTSISANYTQSGTVYDTDSLDDLKSDLVVTANLSNGTSTTVPSADYTLSGTLTEGDSTITVAYGGQTATFTVTVSAKKSDMTQWTDGIAYTDLEVVANQYVKAADGTIANYNGWSRTGYVPCEGASTITFPAMPNSGTGNVNGSNAFYTSDHVRVAGIAIYKVGGATVNVPSNAAYFAISGTDADVANSISTGIVPHA